MLFVVVRLFLLCFMPNAHIFQQITESIFRNFLRIFAAIEIFTHFAQFCNTGINIFEYHDITLHQSLAIFLNFVLRLIVGGNGCSGGVELGNKILVRTRLCLVLSIFAGCACIICVFYSRLFGRGFASSGLSLQAVPALFVFFILTGKTCPDKSRRGTASSQLTRLNSQKSLKSL
jgi:hypothetical protein